MSRSTRTSRSASRFSVRLREAIFAGQLVPGTPLSEKEVSDMFQVSRQPVREAFIKLVEAGVLQVLPQRGTFVKRISPRKVREGRFIREAIETAVVRKAAVSITDEQLQALADNLRDQKLAAKSNDTAAFPRARRGVSLRDRSGDRLHGGMGNDPGHQGADGPGALSEPARGVAARFADQAARKNSRRPAARTTRAPRKRRCAAICARF